ncbi:diacylglycerol/lipid kinase family protein [Edaphobacter aggregans]|uniref:diacylglycerol/lipid kinase family protein n=1 Tax=Edaphobacter aggregans TaxID=570835 RepID=UPI00068AA969|nr:diacylglycerol kinase family protein [Edaphobacter aggregans]
MRKILLLVNPLLASRGSRDIARVLGVFKQAEVEIELLETGANRAAGGKAKHAVKQGVDAVIVCGGDGTVFDTLQGLAGSEVPLGILPLGTGNILAKNLRIPSKPVEAARWLLSASPRAVRLGKITCGVPGGKRSWFFAMAAGMGPHAAMMEVARRHQKDRTGRAAYFAAGCKLLFSHPLKTFDLEITTVDGKVHERRVSEVIAVRVAQLNLWRPGGSLESSFLRLASVEGDSRWRLTQASFQALFLGAGRRDRTRKSGVASYEDVLRVECRPTPGVNYDPSVMVEADGEILGSSCATIEMADVTVMLLSQ